MGFLGFLKKDKAQAPPAPQPQDYSGMDLGEIGKRIGMEAPPTRPEGDYDDVPVPPPSMQDPDFLESAVQSMQPSRDDELAMMPTQPPQESKPVPPKASPFDMPQAPPMPAPPPEPVKQELPDELPDFSDEEIAAITAPPKVEPVPPKASPSEMPKIPPEPSEPARPAAKETARPWTLPPAQMAEPEQPDDVQPMPAPAAFGALQPAMFLSADAYFTLADAIAQARRSLRANEEVLKEAELQHEKGDEQLERFAAEVNAVQERLMALDASLFEE